MSLRVEKVSTTSGFEALQHNWNALMDDCHSITIFSSWDWMFTWWQVFGITFKRELYILCVYEGTKLVGIAPLQSVKSYPLSFVLGKTLGFIGNIEPDEDSIFSQFNDLIIATGHEQSVCTVVKNYLKEHKQDWSSLDFQYLLPDSQVLGCVPQNNAFCCQKLQDGYRFTVPRVNDSSAYQAILGKRWQKMFSKKNRLLMRDGEVSITSGDTPELAQQSLALLAEMHGARWIGKIGKNKFDSKLFYEFHHRILERLVPQGKAFIKTLYLNDKPLASYYAFSDKNQVHYYQSGFFKEFSNKYSPLFILVCKEIGLANEQGYLFDFMFADEETSYKKQQYAAHSEKMYRLICTQSKLRIRFFNFLKEIKVLMNKVCDSTKTKYQDFLKNRSFDLRK